MLKPWWERFPGRLEFEFEELRRNGIDFEQDEDAFQNGRVKLKLHVQVDGEQHDLEVQFPDF